MSPEHNLYVHDKITGHFHHSSFLGGAATVAAGSIVVEQGKLLELTPHSGHYQPSEEDFARRVQGRSRMLVWIREKEIRGSGAHLNPWASSYAPPHRLYGVF